MQTALKSSSLLMTCIAAFVGAIVATVMARSPEKVTGANPALTHSVSPQPAASDSAFTLLGGLGSLPLTCDAQTRSISAENPTGGKGKGAMTVPKPGVKPGDPDQPHAFLSAHLGQGWKTRPFIEVKSGQTATLMDVAGPGIVQHMWIVCGEWGKHGRSCILRAYWDGEDTPSIEAPITDFFAVGHDKFAPVNSLPVIVNSASALNCFWPMPFRTHARITLTNESKTNIGLLAYQINYAETPVPDNAAYFHAQWRRGNTGQENPYVILDGVRGQGQYVGTFLAWTQSTEGWFGEGEIKFYIDGDKEFPTICGTGTEDYFLSSYGFQKVFNTPFVGVALMDGGGKAGTKWSLYRWHVMDPIRFQKDLRVTIQALGWEGNKMAKKADDIASVAYWYQSEPHAPFPKLPSVEERMRDAPSKKP